MPDTPHNNIIITGIPRCGTTLLTALVDSVPDAVALNEPKWQYDWAVNHPQSTATEFAEWLVQDFSAIRQKLLSCTPIPERRKSDGSAVTNYYQENTQTRVVENTYQVIPFTRTGLSPDFTLAIKHNGLYLGTLEAIIATNAFKIIAIIRNPADVIASWNRSPIPPREGKLSGAALYWDELRSLADRPMELLEKQVVLYDMLCQRLYQHRKQINVITHESLMADHSLLESLVGVGRDNVEKFINKTTKKPENEEKKSIINALIQYGLHYKRFYPQL